MKKKEMYIKDFDASAFRTLYRAYYRSLCMFACRYVNDRAESEDIVQNAMLWLWENRALVEPEKSVRSLLYTMVKNASLNTVARYTVKQRVHEEFYDALCNRCVETEAFAERELRERYLLTLRSMPASYRIAFTMNRFGCMTYAEIAARLNISPKTVAYRITQALKILRLELKDFL
jgi:RNA polymerase sigma-70 factor (ECF subfamily)